jgi:helicase
MLKRLGYMPSIRKMAPRGFGKRESYLLAISGTQGDDFLVKVMGVSPSQIPKGNRTYNTKTLVDGSFRSPIRKIQRVPYSGEVYNLHVEDDESYVCSFAFAVHNSAGINLPARRVIVRDVTRYDVNLGFTPIPVLEVQQMCGRAGRPRYDPYGEAILIAKREEDVDYFLEDYLLSPPEPIESKLGAEPALRVHLLAVVATGHCRTEAEVYDFLGRTFFAFERDVHDLESKVERVLSFLDKEKFIERGKDELRATFFGRRTSDLYIDPLSAVKMRDALLDKYDTTFYWLWATCTTPDMPKLYLRRGDHAWIEEKIAEEALTFPVEDYDFFLAEVKTASLLEDWIEERTEDETTKRFGIGPGDIRRMVDQGEWLLYAMGELAKIFSRPRIQPLAKLIPRLQYGIKEELLPLVQLKGVGRVRARNLVRAGYRKLADLQKASAGDLSRVATIGNALAISIKEQLGKQVKPQELAGQTALSEWGS